MPAQRQVLRFGQPVRDLIGAPGLYFKMPFIDTAVYIDKRILALDDERQEVLVSDNQHANRAAAARSLLPRPGIAHAFLVAGLGWGDMPLPVVAADLAAGRLVRINSRIRSP